MMAGLSQRRYIIERRHIHCGFRKGQFDWRRARKAANGIYLEELGRAHWNAGEARG
jgi:hypothetical protein